MRIKSQCQLRNRGFSLMEATVASAIAAITFAGIIYGYVESSRNAEWSALSLAANSLALQRLEQGRACRWDPEAIPAIDELVSANFPQQVLILDVPVTGTNYVYATNLTTVTTVSTTPPLKMISVDSVWRFPRGKVFTNTVVTYRAPDS
jgi:type II secretory pathway pseudopilin PulG